MWIRLLPAIHRLASGSELEDRVVRHLCNRVAVMLQGRIVEMEGTERLFEAPQHAFTRTLLSAVRDPNPDWRSAWALGREGV